MRLSLKAQQVAGVTTIVGIAVVVLSGIHLASLASVSLHESRSRGQLLAYAIFQRAREVVPGARDPYGALREDPGIRSILESSIAYSENVTYAALLDSSGVAIAHSFRVLEGRPLPPQVDLDTLLERSPVAQLRAIYSDRTLEIRTPLLRGNEQFGAIRIGLSTLLIRNELYRALRPAAATALVALVVATLGAMVLAQWLLQPIHLIRSGLSRLERGEVDVQLDLPPDAAFSDLGATFNMISARLAATAGKTADTGARFETAVERLEDAVAIFNPEADVLFANASMRTIFPETTPGRTLNDCFPAGHPFRVLVGQALTERRSQGPMAVPAPQDSQDVAGEQLVVAHAIEDRERRFVGVMIVARDVGYLSQVQATLRYSQKLAALGRLLAGVAHEVKNPLNAMTIHLELLKQKLSGTIGRGQGERKARRAVTVEAGIAGGSVARSTGPIGVIKNAHGSSTDASDSTPVDMPAVMQHVSTIGDEIQRLDEVVQGFLRFMRPEELRLQPIAVGTLLEDVVRLIRPEADSARVRIETDCPVDLPEINGDAAMLRQALMNLALNACQAMPNGGRLGLRARSVEGRRVEIAVEDTGTGIEPPHLERVFDLYFTTKPGGSGIGLSMVYRIAQSHDGEVEVESTVGKGTTFRLLLPQG